MDHILFAWLLVAVRIEGIRIREVLSDPVGDRRGGRDEVTLVNRVALHAELILGDPHQDDQRRMQPQGFLDDVLQLRDLAQRMETHLLAVGVEVVEFGCDVGIDGRVAHEFDQRPRRRAGTGVVAGEHQRDEHAGDLVGGESQVAVVTGDRHQHVEHVSVGLVGGRVGDPAVHDLGNQSDQTLAGLVADPETLDRQIRVDVAEWVGAALE